MFVAAEQLRGMLNMVDPSGKIAEGEIASIKEKHNCYIFEVYEYIEEFATQIYYAAEYLEDAGEALNSYVE